MKINTDRCVPTVLTVLFFLAASRGSTAPLTLNTIVSGELVKPGQKASYTFSGSAGQRLFYDALQADFSQINTRLIGPSGNPVHINQNSDSDVGPFTLLETGSYSLEVDGVGATTGNYSFRLEDLATQPPLVLGVPINKTLNPGYSVDWYRYTAGGGERLFFDGMGANAGGNWYLFNPANENLASGGIGADFEATLGQPGLYLIAIAGTSANPLPYSVQVSTISYTTNQLLLDTAVVGNITNPGDQVFYTFSGSAGQRLYYDALEADFDSIGVRLLSPGGAIVFVNQNSDSDSSAPFTLTESGTYTLAFDGGGSVTGDFRFRLQNLGVAPVAGFGTPITKVLNPGFSAEWYTFAGSAGQVIYFDGLGANTGGSWFLFGPGNENLGGSGIGADFEVTLPRSGAYWVEIAGNSPSPVTYSVQVGAPELTVVPLVLDSSVIGTIAQPGERDSFTLVASTGQRLYFNSLDRDFESINARLIDPSGAVLWEVNHSSDFGPFTVTQNGTYTLVLDGNGATVGDYSFRLLDLAEASPITLSAVVVGSLAPRSRTDVYQFLGTRGQRIAFDSISASTSEATWRLVGLANQTLASGSILTDLPPVVLGESGALLLLVEGAVENASPLNYQFRLSDTSDAPVATSGLNGVLSGAVTVALPATNTFVASAGVQVYFDSQDRTSGGVAVELRDPANSSVFNIGAASDAGPYLLPASGTYSLITRGTGTYRFRLLNLADAPTLTFGTPTQANLDPGFRTDVYQFTGVVGKRLFYDALDNDFDGVAVRLLAPDGVLRINGNSDSDSALFTLLVPGTYYLFFESQIATVADYNFRLLDVATAPVLPIETAVNGTLSPGLSTALYRFDGNQGRVLFLDAAASNAGGNWGLFGPKNDNLGFSGLAQDFELTLTQTGEYVLALIGNSSNPSPFSFEVYDPNAGVGGPIITTFEASDGIASVEWSAMAGKSYLLQFKANLGDAVWTDVSGAVTASGAVAQKVQVLGAEAVRFYRVRQLP